jgi:hypothetical protein
MMLRTVLLLGYALLLVGCQNAAPNPVINSGSYDWTDQVRDAKGFPLPGWACRAATAASADPRVDALARA